MPETKSNKVMSFLGMALTVSAFTSTFLGGLLWVFEPHIEDAVMAIIEKHKGPSTRGELSEEMDVKPAFVTVEIGKMYKEFKQTKKNIEEFNNTWIPHLEQEKNFYYVGFFVDVVDDKVKYKDFDGDILPCWHDEGGWYYMKQGYKFYK